jgi:hypothetical protein
VNPLYSSLLRIDGALAKAGVPPLSPFWRSECERFYSHPTARLLVEEVGRAGGKNLTSLKMAIAEVLTGSFVIPTGERHYYVHVSENLSEAGKDRRQLEQYLDILHVPYDSAGDAIELRDMPRGFRILAARIGAVSGWRCFGWTLNEAAKLSSDGVNPSAELVASIRAMTTTHPGARGRVISSPLGRTGYFYDLRERGNTDDQVYGHAPSWIANTSITEAQTHKLEPDAHVWAREYLAEPQADALGIVDADDIAALCRNLLPGAGPMRSPALFIDSSAGRGDGWSWCVAGWLAEGDRARVHVSGVQAIEGDFAKTTSFDDVVARIAGKAHGCVVYGDQFQSYSLQSAFGRHGIGFIEKPWSQTSKVEAASSLRRLLRERAIIIEPGPEGDAMRSELLSLQEKFLPSGGLTIQARRTASGHADRASLLLLVARCIADGDLRSLVVTGGQPSAPKANRFAVIRTHFGQDAGSPLEPARTAPLPEQQQPTPGRAVSSAEFFSHPSSRSTGPFHIRGGRSGGWF